MAARVTIRPREYHDSVRLMRISEGLRRQPGVAEAMVMMATPNNRKILAGAGLLTPEVQAAGSDDLVLALTAATDAQADAAMDAALALLGEQGAAGAVLPTSLDAALAAQPDSTLAVISVPGAHAYEQASRALDLGLNVLLFSDNVPLDQERALKEQAARVDRLMMGPDCGTALIGGACLGFANVVARGPVGVVGASGTGMQEITSLLDWLGTGVSHAIGTGGRDLKAEIGGLTMMQGLRLLAADVGTRVIVITSKPPAADIARRITDYCATLDKPVVINFLGDARQGVDGNLTHVPTLSGAALAAARLAGSAADLPELPAAQAGAWLARAGQGLHPGQRYLRGLYAGGTLCYEALLTLTPALGRVHSNLAHGEAALTDLFASRGHTVIDLGEDAYTQGRAHPMIDPYLRNQRILAEAADPETALLLLDLVLGYGAHDTPAADLVRTLDQARAIATGAGRALPVIVTLCGTAGDIQNHAEQTRLLEQAGVLVTRTNAEALRLSGRFIGDLHVQHA